MGDGVGMVDIMVTDPGAMDTGAARRGQLMMKKPLLDPMLMLMPMLGTATMVMLAHGDGEDITDHGDMAIGDAKRGQLTRRPLLDPMLMLMLMLIMATGEVTDHGDMVTGDAKRGQPTRPPSLDLMLTLLPMPMLGMDITDHGDMDTGEGSKR